MTVTVTMTMMVTAAATVTVAMTVPLKLLHWLLVQQSVPNQVLGACHSQNGHEKHCQNTSASVAMDQDMLTKCQSGQCKPRDIGQALLPCDTVQRMLVLQVHPELHAIRMPLDFASVRGDDDICDVATCSWHNIAATPNVEASESIATEPLLNGVHQPGKALLRHSGHALPPEMGHVAHVVLHAASAHTPLQVETALVPCWALDSGRWPLEPKWLRVYVGM